MTTPARQGAAAVALRLSGASYADIAMTLGLSSPQAALQSVTRELSTRIDATSREELRALEAARLDALLDSVWAKATGVDGHDEHLEAVRTAMRLIDRRIRLYGLDAPTEVVVHTPTQTEIDVWVAQMVTHTMPALPEPDIVDV
jgi:hypothetical protein